MPETRVPAECFPVSEFIVEEMEERGWTKDQLAFMLTWTHTTLDALLAQQEPLTDDQATDLERVFGVSQRFWLNLEVAYRRWKHAKIRERFSDKRRRSPASRRGEGEG